MNGTWRRSCMAILGGAAALLAASGCVKSSIEVKIRKDGSGRIIVTQVFPREIVNQMAMQRQASSYGLGRGLMSTSVSTNRDPFFDLKTLKKNASQFGSGVAFVKARKIEVEGARGYVALYSFKDINEVFFSLDGISRNTQTSLNQFQGFSDEDEEDTADAEEMAMASARRDGGEGCYEFKLTLGATNRLQVMCPSGMNDERMGLRITGMDMDDEMDEDGQPKTEEEEDEAAERGGRVRHSAYMNPMQAAYARYAYAYDGEEDYGAAALKGTHVSIAVEMEGQDAKTTASLPDTTRKNRFYLLNFDADTLAASPNGKKAVKMASRFGYGNPGMLLGVAAQSGLPIMETNRMVTVDFK